MTQVAYKIVFIRHSDSVYSVENRFCGWYDAELSGKGINDAKQAAKNLKEAGFTFDLAYTSYLKRTIKTLFYIQDELDLHWIPVVKSWKLNERMYGALEGLNRCETAELYGEDQVKIWRRTYDIRPPPISDDDPNLPEKDPKYASLDRNDLPKTECLKDMEKRLIPFWNEQVVPEIKNGKRILMVLHGSSIRALSKHLDNISDNDISQLDIPTSFPLVYELDSDLKPIRHYYLGDQESIQKAIQEIRDLVKIKIKKDH